MLHLFVAICHSRMFRAKTGTSKGTVVDQKPFPFTIAAKKPRQIALFYVSYSTVMIRDFLLYSNYLVYEYVYKDT